MTRRISSLAVTVAVGVPLAAVIVLAAYAQHTETVVAGDGTAEVVVRVYAWGFSPSVIRVVPGQRVRFVATSEDVRHGFAINELGVNMALGPHRESRSPEVAVTLPEGTYSIHCSVFCGLGHPSMKGRLVVGSPPASRAERAPWAASVLAVTTVVVALMIRPRRRVGHRARASGEGRPSRPHDRQADG